MVLEILISTNMELDNEKNKMRGVISEEHLGNKELNISQLNLNPLNKYGCGILK